MTVNQYLEAHILLFDGAMGSYFSAIHSDPDYPCEWANLSHPQTISEIHRRYLKAGAKAIKTNTFSLPFAQEAPYSWEEIVKSAYKLAKDQAEPAGAFVFADIHIPTPTGEEDLLPHFQAVVDLFLEEGASCFLFETCSSTLYLRELAEYIRKKKENAFLLASFALGMDGFSATGCWGEELLAETAPYFDRVGLNCICGPRHMLDLVTEQQFSQLHSVMPNASYPTVLGKRVSYGQNPQYFAEEMLKIAQEGVSILGGCCGTTPEFIAHLHGSLTPPRPKEKRPQAPVISSKEPPVSDFYQKLKEGKKPIAVEWDSPTQPEIKGYMEKAREIQRAGADLITIADCPVARPRLDSSLTACKLKRELGMNALPHMTCRDRNINAAKALLLGLSVEEIRDILLITGDPVPQEQRKEIKTVYEFNSRMLIKHISTLNHSLFTAPFYLYAALNVNAVNFQVQLRMAQEKISHGACALFTQPVMSQRGYDNLKLAKETLSVPLVGGIFPAISQRNISFLSNEISGFHVSPDLAALYQDKTPQECGEIALRTSRQIAREIAPFVDGFYLITPFQRVDLVLEIMKTLKELQ